METDQETELAKLRKLVGEIRSEAHFVINSCRAPRWNGKELARVVMEMIDESGVLE